MSKQQLYACPRLLAWLCERLVGRSAEHALGDLAEEYESRVGLTSARSANSWYLMQLLRSLPTLVACALRQAGILRTIAVAAAVYVMQAAVAESLVHLATTVPFSREVCRCVIGTVVGLPMIAGGGYVASRISQPAALVMAGIMLVFFLAIMLKEGHSAPSNLVLFIVFGPAAALAGGVLAARSR